VSWYFNDGVFLSGNPTFIMASNICTNLVVEGWATFTNFCVLLNRSTNSTAKISGRSWVGGSSQAVYFQLSTSNNVYLNFDTAKGTVISYLDENSTTGATNMVNRTFLKCRVSAEVNAAPTTTGQSNCVVTIRAPEVFVLATDTTIHCALF
jgi:hypothetical protein